MKRTIWRNGAGLGGLLSVAAWVTFGPMGCGGARVTTEADVLAILEQPRSEEETQALADDGRRAYLRHSCHNCHGLDGGQPNGAPQLRNLYTTRAELTDHTQLDRDRGYVVRSILAPEEHVVAGHPQQMSSGYRFAPPEDLAAIVLYLERFSPPPREATHNQPDFGVDRGASNAATPPTRSPDDPEPDSPGSANR